MQKVFTYVYIFIYTQYIPGISGDLWRWDRPVLVGHVWKHGPCSRWLILVARVMAQRQM